MFGRRRFLFFFLCSLSLSPLPSLSAIILLPNSSFHMQRTNMNDCLRKLQHIEWEVSRIPLETAFYHYQWNRVANAVHSRDQRSDKYVYCFERPKKCWWNKTDSYNPSEWKCSCWKRENAYFLLRHVIPFVENKCNLNCSLSCMCLSRPVGLTCERAKWHKKWAKHILWAPPVYCWRWNATFSSKFSRDWITEKLMTF